MNRVRQPGARGWARRELSVADLSAALTALSDKLAARGVSASIYVVGGAAIAARHDQRRLTVDVDAAISDPVPVLAAAREVAQEMGLVDDWLNSRATAFMPSFDLPSPAGPGLTVEYAPDEVLLAMKVLAERERDVADLVLLVRRLGLTEPAQVVDIVHDLYPDGWALRMPTDDELLIEAADILSQARHDVSDR